MIRKYCYFKDITIIITIIFIFLYNCQSKLPSKDESRRRGIRIFSDWPYFFLPTGCRTGFRYKPEKIPIMFDASEAFLACSTAASSFPSLRCRCCATGEPQDPYACCIFLCWDPSPGKLLHFSVPALCRSPKGWKNLADLI